MEKKGETKAATTAMQIYIVILQKNGITAYGVLNIPTKIVGNKEKRHNSMVRKRLCCLLNFPCWNHS
jgi:hypothetical protein